MLLSNLAVYSFQKMRAKQIEQASLGQGPCSYQPAGSDRFSDGFHLGSHSPPSSERRSSSFSSGIVAATAGSAANTSYIFYFLLNAAS